VRRKTIRQGAGRLAMKFSGWLAPDPRSQQLQQLAGTRSDPNPQDPAPAPQDPATS
jgi:hypothetical protein